MTSHTSCSKDVYLPSEVMKDNHEQKNASVEDKHVGINGNEKTAIGIELLTNKDEGARKQSSKLSVAETFGWKPGLQRWLTLLEAFKDSGTIVHFAPMSDELNSIKPLSVAQVVNQSPQDSIVIIPVGVTTNVSGYFGSNKRDILWSPVEIQDLCPSLEGDKDIFDGQKDISIPQKIKNIEGIVKIGTRLSIKRKRTRKSRSELSVAQNFEWKPGLKFWLNGKWRQFENGLNEESGVIMPKNGSLVVVELLSKNKTKSLERRYLGRKFKSSRRLTDDKRLGKALHLMYILLYQGYYVGHTDLVLALIEFYSVSSTYQSKVPQTPTHQWSSLLVQIKASITCFIHYLCKQEQSLPVSELIKRWRKETSSLIHLIDYCNLAFPGIYGSSLTSTGLKIEYIVTSCKSYSSKKSFLSDNGTRVSLANFGKLIIFESLFIQGVQWYWNELIKMLQHGSKVKHLYNEAEFTKDLEDIFPFSAAFFVDCYSSQTKLKTFDVHDDMFATDFIEERMIKNKEQTVKRWLVKWKWKDTISGMVSYLDPWGQGSFEGEGIVMCLTQVRGPLCHFYFYEVYYVIFYYVEPTYKQLE
ncbi:F-box domain, cyclin-like protein [Artemisia annua]|uniref:F-box domain, cyclin-like protein n=1 Tax=Artemisia annua TaxID=35608 RepID=A0A2U1L0L2_ARTAN|nr:F-box domain, cyclin-like protein [Artemisia annua]